MIDLRSDEHETDTVGLPGEGSRHSITGALFEDAGTGGPLVTYNLLNDFTNLVKMVEQQLEYGNWLDAYLLSAGINQITEDYLHRDFVHLGEVAARVEHLGPRAGRVARILLWLRFIAARLRSCGTQDRHLMKWQRRLAILVQVLADRVAGRMTITSVSDFGRASIVYALQQPEHFARGRSSAMAENLIAGTHKFPRNLQRTVLRLPSCFRYYDMQPADCRQLVRSFAAVHPEPNVPILVVGIRTAGNYLAPLCAAFLKREGYPRVETITLRAGQPLLGGELRRSVRPVQQRGFALLIDDPPRSGRSLAEVAAQLRRAGVPTSRIILLCPVHCTSSSVVLPARLQAFETHVLPWDRWAIHDYLTPESVRETLTELLGGRNISSSAPDGVRSQIRVGVVGNVEKVGLPEGTDLKSSSPPSLNPGWRAHRHVRGLFRVDILDAESGQHREHYVYAKGTGLGYFGRYSLSIAGRLAEFVPEVYGLRQGLLYRAWLLEENRISPECFQDTRAVAHRVASYVSARRRLLRVGRDPTAGLLGVKSVWQAVAKFFLVQPFGRLALVAYPLMLPAARSLLHVSRPAVADGSMALSQWFTSLGEADREPDLLKVDFDDSAYFQHEQHSYDTSFDVACAAADSELGQSTGPVPNEFSKSLRHDYENSTGDVIDEERWLLYRTVYLLNYQELLRSLWAATTRKASEGTVHSGAGAPAQAPPGTTSRFRSTLVDDMRSVQRALARVHQSYYEQLYFASVAPVRDGPLCAIDIDNVLETRVLGFTAITPEGARTLRALTLHGYRVVLATGRSLGEVIERCKAYRLAGGVAEYGCATYCADTGSVQLLVPAADRTNVARVRTSLSRIEGVYIDSDYLHAVRAYRVDSTGRRHGLDPALADAILSECGLSQRTSPVFGASTDFVPSRIDKGTGLRALAAELDRVSRTSGLPLACAVGDAASDLPLLQLTEAAYAPANAEAALRTAHVSITGGSCQVGLAEAVGRVLGHRPGSCAICRVPQFPPRTRFLLSILAVQDAHGWRKANAALRLCPGLLLDMRRDHNTPVEALNS